MLASMFKKRVPGNKSHRADDAADWANTSAPLADTRSSTSADRALPRSSSESSVLSNLLHAHPNLSVFRNSTKANRSLPWSSTPTGSPTPARPRAQTTASRMTPQRPSVKSFFLQRNHSMESLTSPGRSRDKRRENEVPDDDGEDTFFTPGKENESDWAMNPASPSVVKAAGSSPYLSPHKTGSKSSPNVSGAGLDSPASDAFHSFHYLESVPPGTPLSSKKGILRDPARGNGDPASGSSVRFFSRDNVHIISPNTSTASGLSSPTDSTSPASFDGHGSEAEDFSMATGVPTLSSSLTYRDQTADPSFFPAASQMPATPLQGPASRSFLDKLQGVSPATPNDGDLTIGMLAGKEEAHSTTPSRAPSSQRHGVATHGFPSYQPSPLSVAGLENESVTSAPDESHVSTLLSMDMLNPPPDMSNLRDTTNRLPPDDDATTTTGAPSDASDDAPTWTSLDSAPDRSPSDELPTPTSSNFPYRDLESSVKSCGRSAGHDDMSPADGSGDSTQTVVVHADGDISAEQQRTRLATQSSFSSVLDFYSRSPPRKNSPPVPSSSDSCGDLTIYHTPRADLQLRILQMEMESPAEEMRDPDRSAFDPDASFSRSIIDRGLSPGQPGSPSVILSFLEGDSVDYAPSSPLTPSLVASFPRAPSPGQQVMVPTSDVPSLNADFYQSHQQLLHVTQKKYDLQVEISTELESTLRRKEGELKATRAQIARMGEVRDLEVRLEMQRHDAEQARAALAHEVGLKDEALARAAEMQERLAQREAEVRDLEVKANAVVSTGAASAPSDPIPATANLTDKLAERDAEVAQLQAQVAEQLVEIKRLAARVIDSAVDRDAALEQASTLEQDAIAAALTKEALEGKLADRERVVERLEAALEASTAESMDQIQNILSSHHQQSSNLRAQKVALEDEVARLRSAQPVTDNADPSVLVVTLAAARRDLERFAEQAAKDTRTIKMHQEELDHQWKRAEETHDDLTRLKQHRDQLVESLQRTDETIDGLQADLDAVQQERDELLSEREDLVAERDDALANGVAREGSPDEWEAERDELVAERDAILGERDAAWEEREDLLAQLDDHSQALADKIAEVEHLTQAINSAQDRHSLELEELKRVRLANSDLTASRDRYAAKADALQDQLATVSSTLEAKASAVASLQARLDKADEASHALARDARTTLEDACHQRDKKIRSLQHALQEKAREVGELERDQSDLSRRFEGLVTEHASRSVEMQTSSFRSVAESGELERLTKQIAKLKAEDSAKEVRILHLLRSRDEVRETLEGVEIALDSKQQELELVKRKFGVRGVGGCTPAPAGRASVGGGSASVSRRHSVAPATPSVNGPSSSFGPRASLGSTTIPETPGPLGRAAAARPRSSLAMGTPGLKHVPSVSRPRSSLDTPSSSVAAGRGGSVPTPSTASRAPAARAARLSAASSSVQESPAPPASAAARSGRPSTSLASATRPLSETLAFSANATPRRSSLSSSASKPSSSFAAPTPRRSLAGNPPPTPQPTAKKRLSTTPRFPAVDGVVADLREVDGDKENERATGDAPSRERQLAD